MSINPFQELNIDSIAQQIVAIGALGTAAFGLVDATKAVWGGVSNRGFSAIQGALEPFNTALSQALGDEPGCDWKTMLKSHWINGRPKDEQKAVAVSLIQLGLTSENAPALATAGQVDPAALQGVVTALTSGADLTPAQVNVLGRFKATIEARIDAAYERADQQYRTTARGLAGLVAVLLAVAVVAIQAHGAFTWKPYLSAVLVGLVAVPLAPIARDLASLLRTTATALGRRVAG
jgi:hypothetical protein